MTDANPSLRPTLRPCPVCKRPAQADSRPFCSKRCAEVDLQRWFTGGYAIPGKPAEDENED